MRNRVLVGVGAAVRACAGGGLCVVAAELAFPANCLRFASGAAVGRRVLVSVGAAVRACARGCLCVGADELAFPATCLCFATCGAMAV